MDQVLDFFRKLFDVSDWPPRWHCGNWTEFHGWLYIISDLLIWSAYFAIPLVILKFISRRTGGKFIKTYFLFAAFILACGSTHLLDAITFWFPAYRLNALVKFFTGVISWVTVFHLINMLPIASSLRPYEELEKEINERKRVEEELKTSNEQLNIAQEIAKLGHWQLNIPDNSVSGSRQLFKIFDIASRENGLTYDDFMARIHPEDREMMRENMKEALATQTFRPLVHRIILDDGTEKILQASGEVISDDNGNIIKVIGTAQDITDQQRSQQQLLERTRELEMSNSELKKFAYIASHDLQEPLRKIMTFSSLLQKEIPNPDERVKLYMDKIFVASGRMQRLIEDILKFSSIKPEPEAFEKVNLNIIISQVISDLEVQVEDANAKIIVDDLPAIEAIPGQMRQVFQNLIVNAIKFRREGIPPEISIKGKIVNSREISELLHHADHSGLNRNIFNRDRNYFLRLEIRDNGIGFDEKYAGKIFEIFQKLHTGGYAGTGIGLAICKKIVDNHYGIIKAESKPGEGATFIIYLPVSHAKMTRKG